MQRFSASPILPAANPRPVDMAVPSLAMNSSFLRRCMSRQRYDCLEASLQPSKRTILTSCEYDDTDRRLMVKVRQTTPGTTFNDRRYTDKKVSHFCQVEDPKYFSFLEIPDKPKRFR